MTVLLLLDTRRILAMPHKQEYPIYVVIEVETHENMSNFVLIKSGIPELKVSLGQSCTIGRSSECELQLLDPLLSRHHTRMTLRDNEYWVEDLNSKNGTFLNGDRIDVPLKLRKGDEVVIGNTSFIFDPDIEILFDQRGEKTVLVVDDQEQLNADTLVEPESLHTLPKSSLVEIHTFACEVLGLLELNSLLDSLLQKFVSHFGADRGFILLKDRNRDRFRPAAIKSEKSSIALSQTLLDRVVRDKKPLLVQNAVENVSFVNAKSIIKHQLRSVMILPLIAKQEIIGVVQIDRAEQNSFDLETLGKFSLLAESASIAVQNAIRFDLERRRNFAQDGGDKSTTFVGESKKIKTLIQTTRKTALSDARVLITGESGTGKELIARMIHEHSDRTHGPWVAVNCGAFPESLIEAEIFGHEKGAFTGASHMRRGCFELADRGTLFLDEVGELPLQTQVKLLRVIEEGSFYRIGAERPIIVDVRIVAATNKNLKEDVVRGNFREDLYYRLNVINLDIPPIRDRENDIELLVDYFVREISRSLGCPAPIVGSEVLDIMQAYHWPGNARQLRNVIERLIVINDNREIEAGDLPPELLAGVEKAAPQPKNPGNLRQALATKERELIIATLKETRWKKAKACRLLGISRPTLDKKILDYGIQT